MEHQHQQKYTCPMHPEIIQDKPGNCPKCGMNLVPVNAEAGKLSSPHHVDAIQSMGSCRTGALFMMNSTLRKLHGNFITAVWHILSINFLK